MVFSFFSTQPFSEPAVTCYELDSDEVYCNLFEIQILSAWNYFGKDIQIFFSFIHGPLTM